MRGRHAAYTNPHSVQHSFKQSRNVGSLGHLKTCIYFMILDWHDLEVIGHDERRVRPHLAHPRQPFDDSLSGFRRKELGCIICAEGDDMKCAIVSHRAILASESPSVCRRDSLSTIPSMRFVNSPRTEFGCSA